MRSEDTVRLPSLDSIGASQWEKLAACRVYFGHQSVGLNILEGVRDLMQENAALRLRIAETDRAEDLTSPVLAHSRVGSNRDPKSKIDAFVAKMEGSLGDKVGVALVKFCYVDVTSSTDVDRLFEDYRVAMGHLRRRFPHIVFVHVTVPLTVAESGSKPWLKRLLGRTTGNDDNIQRTRFNDLLLNEYGGKEPVFDLALAESTAADGTRRQYEQGNATFYALLPDYTDDGGHLNLRGRRHVATQLLVCLAQAAERAPADAKAAGER